MRLRFGLCVPLPRVTKGQPQSLLSPLAEYPQVTISFGQHLDRRPIFQAGAHLSLSSPCTLSVRRTVMRKSPRDLDSVLLGVPQAFDDLADPAKHDTASENRYTLLSEYRRPFAT